MLSNKKNTPVYLLRMLRTFFILRLSEFVVGVCLLATFLAVFENSQDKSFFQYIFSEIRFIVAFGLIYYTSFLYLVFSFFIFVIFWSKYENNPIYLFVVNSAVYAVHAFPLLLLFAVEPLRVSLWIVWVLLIFYNYFFPRYLLKRWRFAFP